MPIHFGDAQLHKAEKLSDRERGESGYARAHLVPPRLVWPQRTMGAADSYLPLRILSAQ